MPNYTEQALHRRAADFYDRIAVRDPNEWSDIQDISPQLRGFRHRILGNDCRGAAKEVEDISFHLLAWGFFDRLIEMRQGLNQKTESGECEEPLEVADRIDNEGGLGLAYLFSGRPHEASTFIMRAQLEAKTEADKPKQRSASRKEWKKVQGKWLGYLAWSEAYKGQVAEAWVLFNEALDIAVETGDKLHGAFWRNELGWLSLDYYQDAVEAQQHLSASVAEFGKLSKSTEAKRNSIYFYPNWALGDTDLGRAHALLGHYDKAEDHYRKAIEKFQKVKHRRWGRGLMPGNVGSFLREKGFPDEARRVYELVIANQRQIGDRRGEQIACARLGNVHRDLAWRAFLSNDRGRAEAELQSAIQYFDSCNSLAGAGRDLKRATRGLRRLGNVHRELGRFSRGSKDGREQHARALEFSETYHKQAHRTAPESFVTDGKNGGDEFREQLFDWLEQTRLNLEKKPAEASFPEVTKAIWQHKDVQVLIAMGLVLLRDANAYDGQEHKITSAKAAFAAAIDLAEKEIAKVNRTKADVRDLRKRLKLDYAIATATVGMAVTAGGKDREKHQRVANDRFSVLIKQLPSPDLIRDACMVLLMMQDPFSGRKDGADQNAVIDSALDVLASGMAARSLEKGSGEEQLFSQVQTLFSAEADGRSSSAAV